MFKWLQKRLMGLLVGKLYRGVTIDDILGISINGLRPRMTFRGKELDDEQIQLIKENAENFENSLLWKFMENRIRHESQDKMFISSRVDSDLIFGKAMLYNLDVIKTIIKEIKEFK